jgi:gliding motility-associated-like protein
MNQKALYIKRDSLQFFSAFLSIGLLLLFSLRSEAQVNALFDVSQSVGCDSLEVLIFNHSTGEGELTHTWNLDDGGLNFIDNHDTLIASYNHPGTYTIVLWVESDQGTSDQYSLEVQVHASPTAGFSTPVKKACAPFIISFTNMSTEGDAPIVSYLYDFHDGSSDNDPDPEKNFSQTGIHDVTLTVEDTNGCISSMHKKDYIYMAAQPVAGISSNEPYIGCETPYNILFINTSVVDTALSYSYQWDFGNSTIFAARYPDTVTYTDYQAYDVTLHIYNNMLGCASNAGRTVTIYNVQAGFDLEQKSHFYQDGDTLCPDSVKLTNQGNQVTFAWHVNQNIYYFQNELNISLDTGWREIKQEAWRHTCRDTAVKNVYVESVSAYFDFEDSYACSFPFPIQVRDSSHNAVNWEWVFEGDSLLYGEDPGVYGALRQPYDTFSHAINVFEIPVSLTVYSSNGCSDSYTSQAEVYLPVARFMPDITAGCTGLKVSFSDSSRSNEPIIDWHWMTGDGVTSQTDTGFFQYTFDSAGIYPVRLAIENDQGCTDTSYAIFIRVGDTLQPNFSVPDTVCNNSWMTITGLTPGSLIQEWHYQSPAFNVSGCHTDASPSVLINADSIGCYDIHLAVSYNGCVSDTLIDKVFCVTGPLADFTYTSTCEDPYDFIFDAVLSSDVNIFYWEVNGVQKDTNTIQMLHSFTSRGKHQVKLIAEKDSCIIAKSYDVMVYDPEAVIDAPSDVCARDTVLFSSASSIGLFDSCYWENTTWDFQDGTPPVHTKSSEVLHFFPAKGLFEVMLIARAPNGCKDSTSHLVEVRKPVASFIADDTIGCSPNAIFLLENTLEDSTVISWTWHLYNNKTVHNDTLVYDSIMIETNEVHSPVLIVADAFSCKDTLVKDLTLLAPLAELNMHSRYLCKGDTARFYNEAFPGADSVRWLFNDTLALVSYDNTMKGIFPFGSYDVEMIVYKDVCSDTVRYDNFFSVQLAEADFAVGLLDEGSITLPVDYVSDTAFYCYPLHLNFRYLDKGTYPLYGRWYFGVSAHQQEWDGDSTAYPYNVPGIYFPSLAIETSNGCKDTATLRLEIIGPEVEVDVSHIAGCKNEEFSFSIIDIIHADTFEWRFGDEQASADSHAVHAYALADFYPVSIWLENALCEIELPIATIEVYPDSAGFELAEPIICRDFTLSLTDVSVNAALSTWDLGDGTVLVNQDPNDHFYAVPDTYMISLKTEGLNGCLDSSTYTLIVLDYPEVEIVVPAGLEICRGESVTLYAGADMPLIAYQWSSEESSESFVEVSPLTDQVFRVEGINEYDCSGVDSVLITVIQEPEITVSSTQETIIIGESVILSASSDDPEASYHWHPYTGLDFKGADSSFAEASPLESTLYTLTVADPCFVNDYNFMVEVEKKYSVSLPQAFTPNGDGINDVVYVRGWGIKELIEFSVYNRFGNRIFFTDDLTTGWDGTFNGRKQPIDSYTYYVRAVTYEDKGLETRGVVNLMR